MSTEAERPEIHVRPRPGVVKTLGILNIVISVAMGACISLSGAWVLLAARATAGRPKPVPVQVAPVGGRPFVAVTADALTLFGVDDPAFLRFSLIDAVTGLIVNVLMFASGVGLVGLKRWGARWWTWLAWTKLIRLVLIWGLFIVAVLPSFSESMGRYMIATMPMAGGRGPTLAQMTRIYAITNLIMAVSMIALGSIYPAVSLWMLGRPGVRAALVATFPTSKGAKLP